MPGELNEEKHHLYNAQWGEIVDQKGHKQTSKIIIKEAQLCFML